MSARTIAGFALIVLSFLSYPAIMTLGATLGITIFSVLVIILLPILFLRIILTRGFYISLILLGASMLSALGVVFLNPSGISLSLKLIGALAVALAALPVCQVVVEDLPIGAIESAAAVGIVGNFLVCLYQIRGFRSGRIPFLSLYQNPSFADIQSISTDYALYIARPFGIFPEPSAMAAVISPWSLWMLVRGNETHGTGRLAKYAVAACGIGSVLLSRSAAIVYVAALLLLLLIIGRWRRKVRVSIGGLFACLIVGAVLYAARPSRISGYNASTAGRADSLLASVTLPLRHATTAMIGVGPGLASHVLQQDGGDVTNIYSVAGQAWAEGGLLAVCCMAAVAYLLIRNLDAAGKICAACWVCGVTFATSYFALGAIWSFAAVLLARAGSGGSRANQVSTLPEDFEHSRRTTISQANHYRQY